MDPYTFTDLFSVFRKGPIFARDFLGIMEDFEIAWPAVELKLAKEGGFEFASWPGFMFCEDGAFKGIQFDHQNQFGIWSNADPSTRALCAADPDRIVFMPDETNGVELKLSLRALHGAPIWTKSEIMTISNVFKLHGFRTRGRDYKRVILCSHGPLGAPLSTFVIHPQPLPIMVD